MAALTMSAVWKSALLHHDSKYVDENEEQSD